MDSPDLSRFRLEAHHSPLEWVTVQRIPRTERTQCWKRGTKRLGKGGFGQVWHEYLDNGPQDIEHRAVKVCDADSDLDRRELQALMEFTRLPTSALFVRLHGWWEEPVEKNICIAMEYFKLGDLSHYLAAANEADCREIMGQLFQAVQVMHEHGFTHRDIKPENILVVQKPPEQPYWHVKVGDFGISKKVDKSLASKPQTERQGTRLYAAPEVLGLTSVNGTPGSTYTDKVDIWSLGCVFFNLASGGHHAFRTGDQSYLQEYCNSTAAFDMQSVQQRLSPAARNLLYQMLSVDPEIRPDAADALRSRWFSETDMGTAASYRASAVLQTTGPLNSFLHSTRQGSSTASNISGDTITAVPISTKPLATAPASFDSPLPSYRPNMIYDQIEPENQSGVFVQTASNTASSGSIGEAPPGKFGYTPLKHKSLQDLRKVAYFGKSSPDLRKDAHFGRSSHGLSKVSLPGDQIAERLPRKNHQIRGLDVMEEWNSDQYDGSQLEKGRTAMHLAAANGDIGSVDLLLELGEDINVKGPHYQTPLHWAVKNGQIAMVDHLHKHGASIEEESRYCPSYMHFAAENGQIAMVDYLQRLGKEINVPDPRSSFTPMHLAAGSGQIAMIDHLEKLGGDITVRSEKGITPMHYAARHGQVETVEHLQKLGADINVKDRDGETPMHYAARNGQIPTVAGLLRLGADINVRMKDGRTPLTVARSNDQTIMREHLRSLGGKDWGWRKFLPR